MTSMDDSVLKFRVVPTGLVRIPFLTQDFRPELSYGAPTALSPQGFSWLVVPLCAEQWNHPIARGVSSGCNPCKANDSQATTNDRPYMRALNGSKAMLRACLIAVDSRRWCGVHTPLRRRGTILPLSATNCESSR